MSVSRPSCLAEHLLNLHSLSTTVKANVVAEDVHMLDSDIWVTVSLGLTTSNATGHCPFPLRGFYVLSI